MREVPPILYMAITADIIDSRSFLGRGKPAQLSELRERLEEIRDPDTVMPFAVFRGDEIQGLFQLNPRFAQMIRHLRYACRPLKLRVGIGIGSIDEQDRPASDNPWESTGEAFFFAREALDPLKREKRPGTRLRCADGLLQNTVNVVFELLDAHLQKWTNRQWEAVHSYESHGTYARAGQSMGIALQNVSKLCQKAHWRSITHAEQFLGQLLSP